ncbi:accessory factor UbiK family protein [Gammaproteobacteria bacterium]|jgi:BMFP domain-containing protein YqiC|nr:accessory factor UbiK family protein [Gammaproteobacteria bacterium]
MIDKDFLEKLSARLSETLPNPGLVREDIEKQFFSLLQSSLGKLNLVTREEFDSQLKVLKRAEQTIAELETKITELEKTAQD